MLLLIGGPPGAGKTSVAHAFASSRVEPTAVLSLDPIRRQVRSGFWDPQTMGWGDEARRQFDLAQDLCVLQAVRYRSEGFGCVIEDAMFPGPKRASYDRWRDRLNGVPHRLVILLPRLEACLARNRARQGSKRLPDGLVTRFHQESLLWESRADGIVIDTSDLTITATVERLERSLAH